MNWLPLMLLRLVWAQERIAYGSGSRSQEAIDPDEIEEMVARNMAERQERFEAAARQVFVRLLREGKFSECRYLLEKARQEENSERAWIVVSRHQEFAHIRDATLEREHLTLGQIDGDFWRADQRLSDEEFWRLGEALLEDRRTEKAAAGENDDTGQIREAWREGRVLGRKVPQRYARSSVPDERSTVPAARWPDNRVIIGSVPRGKPKP